MQLFNQRQLEILNDHNYDPDATYFYELMSGAFLWSDELPKVSSDLVETFTTITMFFDFYWRIDMI